MSITGTIALGGSSRLGTWGLRQGKDILTETADVPFIDNDLQIFFYSSYGEQIVQLYAGLNDSEKLTGKIEFEKYGGFKAFEITIKRDNELALFADVNTRFYYKNKPLAFGYVSKVPETNQYKSTVKIQGYGYSKKLEEKKVTKSYTNKSVDYILKDLANTYFSDLGLNYNPDKIVTVDTDITSVEWEDKSLKKIINDLITISNQDYQTQEYHYGIDAYGDFYFTGMNNGTIKNTFFEGYNFFEPETDVEIEKIVNKVFMFRTKSGSSKETEFVNSYEDTDSQAEYGTYEKKITVPDYFDNTSIENFANGIINDRKEPKKKIEVRDFLLNNILDVGFYQITTAKRVQKTVLSEFSNLSDFTTNVSNSTLSVTTDNVLTKRRCFKWELSGSSGDSILYNFDNPIYAPTKLRIYFRFSDVGEYLKVTVGREETETQTVNALYNSNNAIFSNSNNKVYIISEPFDNNKSVDADVSNEWFAWNMAFSGVWNINSVEIECYKNNSLTVLIDRMEIYSNSYKSDNLSLESAEYIFSDTSFKGSNVVFGNRPLTVTDEIKKITDKNTIPFDIFSKQ